MSNHAEKAAKIEAAIKWATSYPALDERFRQIILQDCQSVDAVDGRMMTLIDLYDEIDRNRVCLQGFTVPDYKQALIDAMYATRLLRDLMKKIEDAYPCYTCYGRGFGWQHYDERDRMYFSATRRSGKPVLCPACNEGVMVH